MKNVVTKINMGLLPNNCTNYLAPHLILLSNLYNDIFASIGHVIMCLSIASCVLVIYVFLVFPFGYRQIPESRLTLITPTSSTSRPGSKARDNLAFLESSILCFHKLILSTIILHAVQMSLLINIIVSHECMFFLEPITCIPTYEPQR